MQKKQVFFNVNYISIKKIVSQVKAKLKNQKFV